MKSMVVVLVLAILALSNTYHVSHSSHLKYHHNLRMRLTGKVSLKYLNLHGLYKYNKLGSQYTINTDNANDFYQVCIGEKQDVDKIKAVALFEEISSVISKTIASKMNSDFSKDYWVYYVSNEGSCVKTSPLLGLQFMIMPAGDPRQYDFSAPQNRLGFIKVCYNGGAKGLGGSSPQDTSADVKKPYILMNCAFDTCETAKYFDNQMMTLDSGMGKQRGNCKHEIDPEESVTV